MVETATGRKGWRVVVEFDEIEWCDTAQYGRICGLAADKAVFARAKNGLIWEPEVAVTFGRLIRPNSTAIDAGSNIGLHAISMVARSAAIQVLAFEPHPEIFRCLELNAKSWPSIRPINKALGRETGTLWMRRLNGDSHPAGAHLFETADDYPVEVITLDSMNPVNVSLIKIDVEGSEWDTIKGAMGLIQRERPALVVEILPNDAKRRADLIYLIRGLGYQVEELNSEDVLFTPI